MYKGSLFSTPFPAFSENLIFLIFTLPTLKQLMGLLLNNVPRVDLKGAHEEMKSSLEEGLVVLAVAVDRPSGSIYVPWNSHQNRLENQPLLVKAQLSASQYEHFNFPFHVLTPGGKGAVCVGFLLDLFQGHIPLELPHFLTYREMGNSPSEAETPISWTYHERALNSLRIHLQSFPKL